MKKLFLVDVSSMFFRAFYAIPPLSSPSGMPTNALYGFLSMTIKLLREIKPDYMAFCFDRPEPSFRSQIFPQYKAQRKEMPDDLKPQVPYLRKLTEVLGIPAIDKLGYEADDVIGSLVKWGRNFDLEVVIVSGDKDFAQLVSSFVSMYDTMKNLRYDSQGVVDKWGVTPHQMVDYLSLVGDSSDNIPGVRGVGPKGAIKLLAEFKSLDAIYENIDNISGKALQTKLRENKEMAFKSRELVKIVEDIDLGFRLEDLRLKPVDRGKLGNLLAELGFKSFEKNLFSDEAKSKNPQSSRASLVQRESASKAKSKGSTWTEENWSLNRIKETIKPYSEVWVIQSERGLLLGTEGVAGYLSASENEVGEVLSAKLLKWKGFDLKEIFLSLQVKDPTVLWDGMLAAYVLRPGGLEDFNKIYQHYVGSSLPDLASADKIMDCHCRLEEVLLEKLEKIGGRGVLEQLELPLVPVLYEMERQGIGLNVQELKIQGEELARDLADLEKQIHEASGEKFNVASPKQLGDILFAKLNLPVGKKTKSGYSTASEVLEKLAIDYPICALVLKYRELAKLKSTYVDALPLLVNKQTNKIHTHFRQAATLTGRLSSVNPNLQNIPIRTERGRRVRRAFIPEEGKVFISADYSQIELRILAHITEDKGLIRAFNEGLDIHSATAAEIFSLPLIEVTPELRRRAKAVNFGIAYGQGAYGLAESLGISRNESSGIIKRYFERFEGVRAYMTETVERAKKTGFTETIFGRRRYIEELKSSNPALRAFGERAAINAPIQGTASDLVKMAMIQIHQEIDLPMLLQVHDELLFECEEAEAEDQSREIQAVMENVAKLCVPLKVNLAIGKNWDEAHA